MSKYVKNLIADELREQFDGVSEALLVTIDGVNAEANRRLRAELRAKNMNLLVVKNSLARRATDGGPLAPAFLDLTGPAAVVWGGEDIVSVAKAVVDISKEKQYQPFEPRGGVMEGQSLSSQEVVAISKWPSREEQLSIVAGQILSVGGGLVSQLTALGSSLASQVTQIAEKQEDAAEPAEG